MVTGVDFLKQTEEAVQGSRFDLPAIIDQYQVMVYNVVLSIVQQEQEAEEATQDVFVKVYRSLKDFRQESTLKTWIYRVAINTALDAQKKVQRQKMKGFFGFGVDAKPDEGVNFYHPGVALDRKEESAMLFKAINALPEKQKTAFVLQKVEGLTAAEIAIITEATIAAVESLLARAKENLRHTLKKMIY